MMMRIEVLICSVLLGLVPGTRAVLSPERGVPLRPFCPPSAPIFCLFPPDEVGPVSSGQPWRWPNGRRGRVGLPAGVYGRVDKGRGVPQCGRGSGEMMRSFRGDEGRWSTEAGREIFATEILMDRIDSVSGNKM